MTNTEPECSYYALTASSSVELYAFVAKILSTVNHRILETRFGFHKDLIYLPNLKAYLVIFYPISDFNYHQFERILKKLDIDFYGVDPEFATTKIKSLRGVLDD